MTNTTSKENTYLNYYTRNQAFNYRHFIFQLYTPLSLGWNGLHTTLHLRK